MNWLALIMFFRAGNDLVQIVKITRRDGINYAFYPFIYWVVFVYAAATIWRLDNAFVG